MKQQWTMKAVFAAVGAITLFGMGTNTWANEEIIKRSQNHNLWAAPGQNLALQRHSQLKDINTGNVKNLQMIWSQSSGTLRGHEGQPVVVEHNGKPMMYMVSGWPNIVQALDLSDPDHPKQIWNYT